MLTRDEIFSHNDLPTRVVEVPEWGGSVTVRGLTAKERDEFEQSMIAVNGKDVRLKLSNARAHLVYLGAVDEQGMRLFEHGDVVKLGQRSAVAIERLAEVIRQLSGLTDSDMEELTANFIPALNGGSTSV